MMRFVDATELKEALESHTVALAANGTTVTRPEISDPATPMEVDEVEALLGFPIPTTLRQAFVTITSGVRWDWRSSVDHRFGAPFKAIFSGGLEWSLHDLVNQHHSYIGWITACFSNPADPYNAVWHRKLGFAHVPNGDVIAVDLDPEHCGAIVYLSHDDGEGHGYVLADSLSDLLDRWVPLACPGPEDWQWLPFVPYDLGPIDPASENGIAWRDLLGLSAAPPRTTASVPDDALFDELLLRYHVAEGAAAAQRLALRALHVCSTNRATEVTGLLNANDGLVQEEAARTLGRWQWLPAIDDLKRIALTGSHNGRTSAILALRTMPGDNAREARADLRTQLDPNWSVHLG